MSTGVHPCRELAGLPGVRVQIEPLDSETWGYYDAESQVIRLDSQLTQVERRCTLQHEILHAQRGDEPCATAWHEAKQERLVDRLAARRLVDLTALADELAWATDEFELADALWIDVATLRARLAGLTSTERQWLGRRLSRNLGAA